MAEACVIRNVRMTLDLDKEIRRIADYEDRTISKTIQRLLQRAVNEYLKDNEQSMIYYEETSNKRFYELLKEADKIADTLDT